jgi:HEPN domain-containing protein
MIADLVIASEDLDPAATLAPLGNRNAVYLCEQAAEKIIRAVLTSEGKHAGIKHQLDEMVNLVPDEKPLKPALREIEQLAAYATAYRYPTSVGRIPKGPSGTELEALIKHVAAALSEAVRRFGVELATQGAPAAKPQPIR